MFSTRQNKVSRLLQREMGDIFQKEALDISNKAILTVTKVRVTPDLKMAKFYMSIFPSHFGDETIKHINTIKSQIRFILGKRIRHQVKEIPEIEFIIDDSLDYIENIERLLKK